MGRAPATEDSDLRKWLLYVDLLVDGPLLRCVSCPLGSLWKNSPSAVSTDQDSSGTLKKRTAVLEEQRRIESHETMNQLHKESPPLLRYCVHQPSARHTVDPKTQKEKLF